LVSKRNPDDAAVLVERPALSFEGYGENLHLDLHRREVVKLNCWPKAMMADTSA